MSPLYPVLCRESDYFIFAVEQKLFSAVSIRPCSKGEAEIACLLLSWGLMAV